MKTIYTLSLCLLFTFCAIPEIFASCSNGQLTLTITFDNNPHETGWQIKDINNTVYAESLVGSYANETPGSTIAEQIPTLPNGDYVLVFLDSGFEWAMLF